MRIDTSWYLDINRFAAATPGLHTVLAGYALWGGLTIMALLLVAGWLRARRQPGPARAVAVAALTGVAAVVAVLANQNLLAPAIARPRPCLALPHVEVLLPCSTDFSMPSDHTVIAGALVAGLWALDRKLGLTATVVALLLAFSRVYVGVHYPLDALVGLLVGAAVAVVVILALRAPTTTLAARLAGTPLGRLVATPARRTGRCRRRRPSPATITSPPAGAPARRRRHRGPRRGVPRG